MRANPLVSFLNDEPIAEPDCQLRLRSMPLLRWSFPPRLDPLQREVISFVAAVSFGKCPLFLIAFLTLRLSDSIALVV